MDFELVLETICILGPVYLAPTQKKAVPPQDGLAKH